MIGRVEFVRIGTCPRFPPIGKCAAAPEIGFDLRELTQQCRLARAAIRLEVKAAQAQERGDARWMVAAYVREIAWPERRAPNCGIFGSGSGTARDELGLEAWTRNAGQIETSGNLAITSDPASLFIADAEFEFRLPVSSLGPPC